MSRARVQRILGAALVAVGCGILVVDISGVDVVVLSVSRTHGVHLSDVVGAVLVVAGVGVLWIAPARRR